jgi:hypothetical protein
VIQQRSLAAPQKEVVVSVSGINALVHVAQLKADIANQRALGDAEGQRQAPGQGSGLDHLLSSSSVLTDLQSSAVASMADKLAGDNETIQQALSAAGETYAKEMDQAASELLTGVAEGMLQLGNATASTAMAGELESSLEYFIGLSARLSQGDVRKDLDALKDRLAELKAAKQSPVAAPHAGGTNGNSDALARIEVEIKEILRQLQAVQAAEQDAKDAASAQGDSSRIEAQLEKSAQAYKDLLDAMRP